MEAVSEALSADNGSTAGSAEDEAGEERSLSLLGVLGLLSLMPGTVTGKRRSRFDGTLRTSTRLLGVVPPDRLERPLAAVVAEVEAGIVFVSTRRWWSTMGKRII